LGRNTAFAGQTAALLGLVAGLALTDSALRRRSNGQAILAGVAWAFAFYASQGMRVVLILLAISGTVALWRPLVRRWQTVSVIAISSLAVLLPMIITAFRHPEVLTGRFQQVSIFGETGSVRNAIMGAAARYVDYFGPQFLLISGDHQLRHHTGHGGELYWSLAPLILVGLWTAIRFWRCEPRYRIVVLGILASPVPAALTVDRMHSTRSASAAIFWLLLAAVGARELWRHRQVGRKLLLGLCAAGLVETTVYLADYFGPYQTRSSAAFETGFTEALKYCFGHLRGNQTFYVSGSVGAACFAYIDTDFKPFIYAFLLFHGHIDPWSYQHGGFSNTVIRPYLERIDHGPGLLLRCNNTAIQKDQHIEIVPNFESVPASAKLLVTFQDETLVYQIWEVE